MFDLWLKHWRRRRILRRPIPLHWPRFLERHLWQFSRLTPAQQNRLLQICQVFIEEKNFEGCQGLEVNDEMKLTIAAAAGLLLLGFNDDYCFDRVRTLLVYPGAMRLRGGVGPVGGIVSPDPWVSGVYSAGNAIVISWGSAEWECANRSGHGNVIIHEFAHHVDDLDGSLDGDPPFDSSRLAKNWRALIRAESEQLADEISAGRPTVLRPYALTNLSEFFAVACEAYFCDAGNLSQQHPHLFEMLMTLFRFDTRALESRS